MRVVLLLAIGLFSAAAASECRGKPHGWLYPSKEGACAQHFYKCEHEEPHLHRCPGELYFNHHKHRCDHKHVVLECSPEYHHHHHRAVHPHHHHHRLEKHEHHAHHHLHEKHVHPQHHHLHEKHDHHAHHHHHRHEKHVHPHLHHHRETYEHHDHHRHDHHNHHDHHHHQHAHHHYHFKCDGKPDGSYALARCSNTFGQCHHGVRSYHKCSTDFVYGGHGSCIHRDECERHHYYPHEHHHGHHDFLDHHGHYDDRHYDHHHGYPDHHDHHHDYPDYHDHHHGYADHHDHHYDHHHDEHHGHHYDHHHEHHFGHHHHHHHPFDCTHKENGYHKLGHCHPSFAMCSNGIFTKQQCPEGLVFHYKIGACDYHDNCIKDIIEPWTLKQTKHPKSPFSCEKREDGPHHLHSCSPEYYNCWGHRPFPTHCPADLVYNKLKHHCDFKHNVPECGVHHDRHPYYKHHYVEHKDHDKHHYVEHEDYDQHHYVEHKDDDKHHYVEHKDLDKHPQEEHKDQDEHPQEEHKSQDEHPQEELKGQDEHPQEVHNEHLETEKFCASKPDGSYAVGCEQYYYSCVGGITHKQDCPPTLYYSESMKQCETKEKVSECKA